MADRKQTPDILGNVLGPVVDDTAIIRQQLRYDYSLIPAAQRTQVQAAAVDIVRAGRQAQESLLSVGQRLTEVKDMLEHGQFSDWCAAEFDMSQRTAQRMMQVAEVFAGKNDKLSLLSDSAMYMLAAPSTPEAARIEVLERAEATGQKPSVSEVKETINRHRPQPTPVKVTRIDDAAEDAWTAKQETPAPIKSEDLTSRLPQAAQDAGFKAWVSYQGSQQRAMGASRPDGRSMGGAGVTWQRVLDWVAELMPPTGRPLMQVIKTDEEIAADAQAADIASRNAAADEAVRQAQADPYDHTHGDAIRNDLAAREAQHVAAAAAADVAFGMAPTRTQVLAKLLQDVMDAIGELSKLSGKAGDCILLQSAAAKVYGGLVASAAPAPASELPDDLKAHGWQLRQVRGGKWIAFVQPEGEEDEIRTNIPREKLSDVIGDARYLDKQLKIGA